MGRGGARWLPETRAGQSAQAAGDGAGWSTLAAGDAGGAERVGCQRWGGLGKTRAWLRPAASDMESGAEDAGDGGRMEHAGVQRWRAV